MGSTMTTTDTTSAATSGSPENRPDQSWWQRNRVWLVALAIVAPITGVTIFSKSAREWRNRHPATTSVDYGSTVELRATGGSSGATIGPATATFSDTVDGPPQTRVVQVSIAIDHGGELNCASPSLRELDGERRRWTSDAEATPVPTNFDEVSAPSTCDSEQNGPYQIETAYWVPDDAVGPFAIEIRTLSPPRVVSLKVRP